MYPRDSPAATFHLFSDERRGGASMCSFAGWMQPAFSPSSPPHFPLPHWLALFARRGHWRSAEGAPDALAAARAGRAQGRASEEGREEEDRIAAPALFPFARVLARPPLFLLDPISPTLQPFFLSLTFSAAVGVEDGVLQIELHFVLSS